MFAALEPRRRWPDPAPKTADRMPTSRLLRWIRSQALHIFVDSGLLHGARRLARELRAVQVGIRASSPPARSTRWRKVSPGWTEYTPGVHEFTAQRDQFGLLRNGHADIGLGEDGDHVSGLQFKILRGVVLQHEFAQVEGNQIVLFSVSGSSRSITA